MAQRSFGVRICRATCSKLIPTAETYGTAIDESSRCLAEKQDRVRRVWSSFKGRCAI